MPKSYTYRDKQTGEKFKFKWNRPGSPTLEDAKEIAGRMVELRNYKKAEKAQESSLAARAANISEVLREPILPEMSPEVSQSVSQYPGPFGINKLIPPAYNAIRGLSSPENVGMAALTAAAPYTFPATGIYYAGEAGINAGEAFSEGRNVEGAINTGLAALMGIPAARSILRPRPSLGTTTIGNVTPEPQPFTDRTADLERVNKVLEVYPEATPEIIRPYARGVYTPPLNTIKAPPAREPFVPVTEEQVNRQILEQAERELAERQTRLLQPKPFNPQEFINERFDAPRVVEPEVPAPQGVATPNELDDVIQKSRPKEPTVEPGFRVIDRRAQGPEDIPTVPNRMQDSITKIRERTIKERLPDSEPVVEAPPVEAPPPEPPTHIEGEPMRIFQPDVDEVLNKPYAPPPPRVETPAPKVETTPTVEVPPKTGPVLPDEPRVERRQGGVSYKHTKPRRAEDQAVIKRFNELREQNTPEAVNEMDKISQANPWIMKDDAWRDTTKRVGERGKSKVPVSDQQDQSYKGYSIRYNPMNQSRWIEKDGKNISSVKSIDEAKQIIDRDLTTTPKVEIPPKQSVNEAFEIKQLGNRWVLKDKATKKTLSTHGSEVEAKSSAEKFLKTERVEAAEKFPLAKKRPKERGSFSNKPVPNTEGIDLTKFDVRVNEYGETIVTRKKPRPVIPAHETENFDRYIESTKQLITESKDSPLTEPELDILKQGYLDRSYAGLPTDNDIVTAGKVDIHRRDFPLAQNRPKERGSITIGGKKKSSRDSFVDDLVNRGIDRARAEKDADNIFGKLPTIPIVQAASKSPDPLIQKAAADTDAKVPGMVRAAYDVIGTSPETQIKRTGAAGEEIARRLSRSRLRGDSYGGRWSRRYQDATKHLDDTQFNQYVEELDTGVRSGDPKVRAAVETTKILDDEVVKAAKAARLGKKDPRTGEISPFTGRANYFPHIYPKDFFEKIHKNKDFRESIIQQMMKKGISRAEADRVLKQSRQHGERLISAQYGRDPFEIPGFIRDRKVMIRHLDDMGRRIALAEEFDPKDIRSGSSIVSQLIEKTNDPAKVRKLLQRILRDEDPHDKRIVELARRITNAESLLHLSHFVISNTNQLAMVPIRSNWKSTIKATWRFATDAKKFYNDAIDDGAIVEITHRQLLDEMGGRGLAGKLYGFGASEKFQRALAAGVGRADAELTFQALKKSPGNSRLRRHMKELLLEDPDIVLKQNSLSDDQIHMAGARLAEITQGLAGPQDLPPAWTSHPLINLVFLYKRFAFRGTKMIVDAIKERPIANSLKAALILPIFGEATGDVKAAISGVVSGTGASKEIEARSKRFPITGNEFVDRMAANYMQAWALGIVGDILESAYRRDSSGLLQFFGGPVISDVSDVGSGVAQATKGNVKPLGRKVTSSVPFVGSGLRKKLFPPQKTQSRNVEIPAY